MSIKFDFKGKKALVTGSSRGIGEAIAVKLVESGCSVIFNGSSTPQKMEKKIKQLQNKYKDQTIEYIQTDLSKPEQVESLVRKSIKVLNGIDILINNAGVQHVSPIETFDISNWNWILQINLTSCFQTMKEVMKYWKQNPNWRTQYGRIINISSVHGIVASRNKSAYIASKHGLNGLTKVVALEAAESKITVNSVCPGWVLTDMVKKQIEKIAKTKNVSFEEAEKLLVQEKQPNKKIATSNQIASYCAYLCSTDCDNITGSLQSIDGGWSTR